MRATYEDPCRRQALAWRGPAPGRGGRGGGTHMLDKILQVVWLVYFENVLALRALQLFRCPPRPGVIERSDGAVPGAGKPCGDSVRYELVRRAERTGRDEGAEEQ